MPAVSASFVTLLLALAATIIFLINGVWLLLAVCFVASAWMAYDAHRQGKLWFRPRGE
jgi:small-conductance mechanosensitive channel